MRLAFLPELMNQWRWGYLGRCSRWACAWLWCGSAVAAGVGCARVGFTALTVDDGGGSDASTTGGDVGRGDEAGLGDPEPGDGAVGDPLSGDTNAAAGDAMSGDATTGDGLGGDDAVGDPIPPSVSLYFDGPLDAVVGACSSEISLAQVPPGPMVVATLTASVQSVGIYSDPACTVPLSSVAVAGDGAISVLRILGSAPGMVRLTATVGATSTSIDLDLLASMGWTAVANAGQPGARYGAAMAPEGSGAVLLHGGAVGGTMAMPDLWAWAGGAWVLVDANTTPGTRVGAALVWDLERDRHVLAGGAPDVTSTAGLDEVWEYQGGSWRLIDTSTSGYLGRVTAGAAFDPLRARVVIFGGLITNDTPDDALFEIDGDTVIGPLRPTPRPLARWNTACAFDPTLGEVACYGGSTDNGATMIDDLWTWDGTRWLRRCQTCTGTPRFGAMLAHHTARNLLLIGMGYDGGQELSGTRRWDGASFGVYDAANPPARDTVSWAYDPVSARLVVYGGNGPSCSGVGGYCDDTWVLR